MRKNLQSVLLILLFTIFTVSVQSQSCGGVCSGFRTQTQGGWGATPNGGNPGVYLHNNFAAAFPSGLTIGSATKTVKFTTAQSITDNLPAGGGPKALPSGNVTNPLAGYLNTELDGQIVAAMLSVGFDVNDASFSISSGVLGNLVFNSGTFNGKSVQFVIDEANKAIGSIGSSYSLTDLNTALDSFNNNYDNGTSGSGNGNFNCPGAPPTVAAITGSTSLCNSASINLADVTTGGIWSSDNSAVATIDGTGKVTSKSVGTATISYAVTSSCGTTTVNQIITVNDCNGVESGDHGGLESKSLGDAVGNRIFNKAVNSLQGPTDYSKMELVASNAIMNRAMGVGTKISLAEILPKQIIGSNYTVFNSTPADIPSITNAQDVLSIDYTSSNKARAVAFGTKTLGQVYDHTKVICDRLKGSELMNVQNVTVNNIQLVRYDLKNTAGQMEYTFSFAIGAKTGRQNYTIQSNWLNKDYTADEVMFNIQLWAETPSLIETMASDIITRLNNSMPVTAVVSNAVIPSTYITKGTRASSNIVLNITNTKAGTSGYFEVKEKANEQSTSVATKQIPFTINTNGTASVNVPSGDSYESTINMYLNGTLQDQVFMSDGNWAVNTNTASSSVKTFTVNNDGKRVVDSNDDFLLFRNVHVEATTPDYISVYKLLRGGGAAQDLTGFKSFQFTAAANGASMNITLVKAGVSNWSDQYSLSVPLSSDTKDYKVNLNDFKTATGKDKINPNDITTVIFALISNTGKITSISADISNVSFSKIDFAYLNSLNSLELNAYPNPSKGRFNANFKSSKATNLILTLRDANTGVPVLTQTINAQVGNNSVPVSYDHKSVMSSYILSLEGQGIRYAPKKVLIDK